MNSSIPAPAARLCHLGDRGKRRRCPIGRRATPDDWPAGGGASRHGAQQHGRLCARLLLPPLPWLVRQLCVTSGKTKTTVDGLPLMPELHTDKRGVSSQCFCSLPAPRLSALLPPSSPCFSSNSGIVSEGWGKRAVLVIAAAQKKKYQMFKAQTSLGEKRVESEPREMARANRQGMARKMKGATAGKQLVRLLRSWAPAPTLGQVQLGGHPAKLLDAGSQLSCSRGSCPPPPRAARQTAGTTGTARRKKE